MAVPLAELLGRISGDIRRTLLCSSFTYPRARSVESYENPQIHIEVHDRLDFRHIRAELANNVEVLALSAKEDLALIVATMEAVQDEIPFEQFEAIEVRRAGILLLRITLPKKSGANNNSPRTPRTSGRVAAVEINEYRREVLKLLAVSHTSPLQFVFGIAVGIVVGIVANYSLVNYFLPA